jgi:hypothetical protein
LRVLYLAQPRNQESMMASQAHHAREGLTAGRIIAALFLLQMILAPIVNFVLVGPALSDPPGFLSNAASHPTRIGVGVLLSLSTALISLGVAIAAWPVLRRHSQAMALWVLALAGIGVATIAVENVMVLSMLSLSQAYTAVDLSKLAPADADAWQMLGAMARSGRKWAHYLNLIVSGTMLFAFYAALLRFALVPRVLAAFGLAAVLLQLVAVAMPLFGHPIMFVLLSPLGLCQLALVAWLTARGFREPA